MDEVSVGLDLNLRIERVVSLNVIHTSLKLIKTDHSQVVRETRV